MPLKVTSFGPLKFEFAATRSPPLSSPHHAVLKHVESCLLAQVWAQVSDSSTTARSHPAHPSPPVRIWRIATLVLRLANPVPVLPSPCLLRIPSSGTILSLHWLTLLVSLLFLLFYFVICPTLFAFSRFSPPPLFLPLVHKILSSL